MDFVEGGLHCNLCKSLAGDVSSGWIETDSGSHIASNARGQVGERSRTRMSQPWTERRVEKRVGCSHIEAKHRDILLVLRLKSARVRDPLCDVRKVKSCCTLTPSHPPSSTARWWQGAESLCIRLSVDPASALSSCLRPLVIPHHHRRPTPPPSTSRARRRDTTTPARDPAPTTRAPRAATRRSVQS